MKQRIRTLKTRLWIKGVEVSQARTIKCDVCDETGSFSKSNKGGAQRKPEGWSIVRYEIKKDSHEVHRLDLCPKHSKEFESRFLKTK